MSIRKVNFVPGEYYHIYNRGNDKRIIFNDNNDYYHFIKLLYLSNTKNKVVLRFVGNDIFNFKKENKLVEIGAWCLMPNHFHLVVTQTEGGNISKFMQKLTTAYSMYYNQKYKRTGSLFEGKFKSQHTPDDRYLKYLFSYIHLNPIKLIQKDWKEKGIINKKEAIDFLYNYKYSSYLDYLENNREESLIINKDVFPNYFPTKEKFQQEIFEWLSFNTH
jgi:putative transposase